jgi:hypothetical protein
MVRSGITLIVDVGAANVGVDEIARKKNEKNLQ